MDTTDLTRYLCPLEADQPAGPDLAYDPDMLELEAALCGRPEVQYGARVIAAQPPDWARVAALAEALAQRTRDLRVAVPLLRAWTHLHGLEGHRRGLALVAGLLEQYPEDLHPQLEHDAGDDPALMRRLALQALDEPGPALVKLCVACLGPGYQDLIHELRQADDRRGLESVELALQDLEYYAPGNLQQIAAIEALLVAIERAWQHAGGEPGLLPRARAIAAALAPSARVAACEHRSEPRDPARDAEAAAVLAAARQWLHGLDVRAAAAGAVAP